PHPPGCFTRKHPTKVHPSPPYAPTYLPKNILPPPLPKQSQLQLPYPIPLPEPLSISINTFHTPNVSQPPVVQAVTKHFDLTP
ncbi:methionine adenosyltransferase domain-containing protein, partial [Staphylococcus epidermidis]|uniref:methionine adenosyltransferase domain-containing protein n=1 Tax=Staphylococcus epidermidis TaxID=1282 RepID=UPI001642BBBD